MSLLALAIVPSTLKLISAPMITATSSRMPMYSPAVWPR